MPAQPVCFSALLERGTKCRREARDLRCGRQRGDGLANALQRDGQLTLNLLDGQPEHREAQALQLGIPAAISGTAICMPIAIHFNDEFDLRGDEVADKQPGDWNLAAELYAQGRAANGGPENAFRFGFVVPIVESELGELRFATSLAARFE